MSLFLLVWIVSSLAIFALARSRMHLYVLPLFVPLALLAARRQSGKSRQSGQPAFTLSPRWRFGLACWVVFLIGLRAAAAQLPVDKDSRVLAQVIAGRARGPINEVVFVDTLPRYGLAFYLGAEVEAVTLRPPLVAMDARKTESLAEELREQEGVRLFILSRKHSAAFLDLSRTLGLAAVPLGSWRGLDLYQSR